MINKTIIKKFPRPCKVPWVDNNTLFSWVIIDFYGHLRPTIVMVGIAYDEVRRGFRNWRRDYPHGYDQEDAKYRESIADILGVKDLYELIKIKPPVPLNEYANNLKEG